MKDFALLLLLLYSIQSAIPLTPDYNSTSYNDTSTYTGAPRVLLIGFGPSGMFFCHALETQRQKLLELDDMEGLSKLPKVSAFERSSTHGGVWRKREKVQVNNNDTAMYEGLWANGAKELAEFFDYTYDEHFGCSLPTYIQRGVILDYMDARVTKHCPNFFEKYVTFNTNVKLVTYDDTTEIFTATIENLQTGEVLSNMYDKVIWAAGVNTIPFMPQSTMKELDGFNGKIIHSSDVSTLEEDIKGKSILLIGGATSAEDLALTAIKLGVEKVHVTFRSENNGVTASKRWPLDKVHLYPGYIPHGVDDDNCIEIEEVDPITLVPDDDDNDDDNEEIEVKICGIDTIIFCTGYKADFKMLHPSVNSGNANVYTGPTSTMKMPVDWKMQPNVLSKHITEEAKPSDNLKYFDKHPNLYRYSVSIDNPSMMYMIPNAVSLDQIIWADVLAHQLYAFITNPKLLPVKSEMKSWLQNKIYDYMDIPLLRRDIDNNYVALLEKYSHTKAEEELETNYDLVREVSNFHFRSLAEIINEINYPIDIGTYEGLNEKGDKLVGFDMHDRNLCNPSSSSSSISSSSSTVCSFRDVDGYDLSFISSIHTGTKAIPFKKPWMELDDFADYTTLCGDIDDMEERLITTSSSNNVSCIAADIM